ncbi:MAG TPA: hypothetical protein VMT82_03020 [candidate division Zixibacteria bacterium]|nr:hypothetical protein [candidate division Zixibacteria bacterium]
MKRSIKIFATLFFAAAVSVACYAKDVALVVAKNSKLTALQSASLAKAFKALPAHLDNGGDVVIVVKALSAPEAQVFATKVLGTSHDNLNDAVAKRSIIVVGSDAEVIRIVASTPNAIGIIDVYSITGAVSVAKVDGKLPLEPGYLLHYN